MKKSLSLSFILFSPRKNITILRFLFVFITIFFFHVEFESFVPRRAKILKRKSFIRVIVLVFISYFFSRISEQKKNTKKIRNGNLQHLPFPEKRKRCFFFCSNLLFCRFSNYLPIERIPICACPTTAIETYAETGFSFSFE